MNDSSHGTTDFVYRLQNVSKEYEGRRVLQVDHLKIERGEVFALVGPSGAGKSTLLRLLNFLEPPTSGRIRFLDAEFSTGQPMPLTHRRRVTTVFQRPILLNRSVQANVGYGLSLRHRRDSSGEIEKALDQVGLRHLSRQRARTLSGGEAQRVALARAIVLQPDVLLLDEPTANLDPYNVGLIEEIVTKLNRERDTTLVLVTHNVFQARRLAHRVGLMLDSQIVEVADVETFSESPHDPRTAAFVRGEMVY
jgi:tungstate transport system ATP-binding protein